MCLSSTILISQFPSIVIVFDDESFMSSTIFLSVSPPPDIPKRNVKIPPTTIAQNRPTPAQKLILVSFLVTLAGCLAISINLLSID